MAGVTLTNKIITKMFINFLHVTRLSNTCFSNICNFVPNQDVLKMFSNLLPTAFCVSLTHRGGGFLVHTPENKLKIT